MPNAANVQRRERSWVLSLGDRQFSFTRVDHSASFATGHRIEAATPRGWRPTAIIGTMLGILGGATLVGLAVNSSRASAGYRYVVTVPIPPARALKVRPAMAVGAHAAKLRPAAIRAAPAMVRDDGGATGTSLDYSVGDLDSVETTAAATSMTSAIRAAMASGHLQQWNAPDGSERGFVVVGPADGSGGCRALSILTRRDGDNHVEQRRECATK
ncbi:hypothetical protein Q5H91_00050 [Sphingomonas sp. KR1UV-12]|uniref:Uncharacterized protein n=1 Tax=Sphingomonas aurea TaxID=3063994 RepID=A0ABT9EF47_9SPHN|nr:hypothetical protein [Sphingomonas sp. KR1UV-12]MDP1025592.1 hypothetical protein [Sphingomonas sp. KR1UV-12]